MPNWVDNYLVVNKEAKKYIVNDENEVDFEILIPMPEEVKNTVAPYDENNWYDWSISNWGCKWNASDTFIEDFDNDKIRITFSTPWVIPIVWIDKLIEMKIDLHLAWFEEQGYRGIITYNSEEDFVEDFDLPEAHWIETEEGDYVLSSDFEKFDWRDILYEGQYEELIDGNDISI